ARRTRSATAGATPPGTPLIARETELFETPATRATSAIVTDVCVLDLELAIGFMKPIAEPTLAAAARSRLLPRRLGGGVEALPQAGVGRRAEQVVERASVAEKRVGEPGMRVRERQLGRAEPQHRPAGEARVQAHARGPEVDRTS